MRGMILALAVSLAVLFMAGEGRADYKSGQDLNEVCSGERYVSKGECIGYIQGVYDAGKLLDAATNKRQWVGGWSACLPDRMKVGQLVAVVKKWLQEHPKDWHYGASGMAVGRI